MSSSSPVPTDGSATRSTPAFSSALLGTALAVGEWRWPLAVVFVGAAYWRKIGIEEAVMRRQFGEAYARYADRCGRWFRSCFDQLKPDCRTKSHSESSSSRTLRRDFAGA